MTRGISCPAVTDEVQSLLLAFYKRTGRAVHKTDLQPIPIANGIIRLEVRVTTSLGVETIGHVWVDASMIIGLAELECGLCN